MNLIEILEDFINSSEKDWNKIGVWGHRTGPAYHDDYRFSGPLNSRILNEAELNIYSFHTVAVLIKNPSITIGWGMKLNEEEYHEGDWGIFYDHPWTEEIVDIFYNNALVIRQPYAIIDAGRYYLPIPRHGQGELYCPKSEFDFVQALNRIGSKEGLQNHYVPHYKERVEIKNEKWPYWA